MTATKYWTVLSLAIFPGAVFGQAEAPAVWTANPLLELREQADSPPKDDPNCAVRLEGTRGGAFSGVVAVGLKTAGPGPELKAGDLKLANGDDVIPASALEIRYALTTGYRGAFDALAETPKPEGTLHPVWVTVNVPRDAKAGTYEGRLDVAGRTVPIQIAVQDWTLPEPKDYTVWADFIQSPESVALHYKTPLWSDEHFRLIETSFAHLGKIGNKTLYLHLCGHSNFGNAETIVRWIKNPEADPAKGPGAAFKHDFSAVEKYLDAYLRQVGKPKAIIMYDWEPYVGGGHKSSRAERCLDIKYTLLDPATGEVSTQRGPNHSHANDLFPNWPDDFFAFWQPVYDGLYQRFKERGMDEAVLCHGLFKDGAQPNKANVENLLKITPWALWAEQNHGSPSRIHGVAVGYGTTVWNVRYPGDPASGRRTYGWQSKRYVAQFDRDMGQGTWQVQIVRSRLLGEMNIAGQQVGFGRMAADFWPVLEGKRGRKRSIVARHPWSSWTQLDLRATPYLYPGPNGALGTLRLEMMREGMQECEARIFIEKALLDKKIGGELAERCQALLDDRVRAIINAHGGQMKKPRHIKEEGMILHANSDWRTNARNLYAAAAEVARVLEANP